MTIKESFNNLKKMFNKKKEVKEIKEESKKTEPEKEENDDEFTNRYKEISPMRLIMRRFFRSKLSIVGIIMIVFLFLFSFLGPLVYRTWGETGVDRNPKIEYIEKTYQVIDENGKTIDITKS